MKVNEILPADTCYFQYMLQKCKGEELPYQLRSRFRQFEVAKSTANSRRSYCISLTINPSLSKHGRTYRIS